MKKLITLILTIVSLGSYSQVLEFKWSTPSTVKLPEGDFFTLTLEGAQYISSNYYLPQISKTVNGHKIHRIEIVNATYTNCSILESKLIDPRFHNTEVVFDINSYTSGSEYINQISFIPLKINSESGIVEKLQSIKYNIIFQKSNTSTIKNKTPKVSTGSVLASGKWNKYRVSTSGVYKLTYSQLKSNGFDVDNLDPQTIKMFNNGSGMLPEANSDFRFDDLNEIPLTVIGEQDGSFDNGDYILFYGESTHKTIYDQSDELFRHKYNLYDNNSYYFITYGGNTGNRITTKTLPLTSDGSVSQFDELKFHESDQENVLLSGREWYGDNFTYINPRTYNLSTPGLVNDSELTITSSMMGMMPGAVGYFRSKVNGVILGTQTIYSSTSSNYGVKGRQTTTDFPINSSSISNPSNVSIEMTWDNTNNSTGSGHTNYFEVNYKRELSTSGSQLLFSSIESINNANTLYQINTTNSSLILWDIENPVEPKNIDFNYSNGTLTFIDSSNVLMKYAVTGTNNFLTPTFSKVIVNQDLHSKSGAYDLLIITPLSLLNEAQAYGEFKTSIGISNEVVLLEEIYNEFSCGAQDLVGIRDFIKYTYDKGSQLQYVLLFGDASFDYKNIQGGNQAFIPIYESYQSLDNISTYSSDDYFGFLEDHEGNWTENYANNHLLNIGVGRLPVKTSSEAQTVITKLMNYVTYEDHLGTWRNNISFVADDGDNALHIRQADELSEIVEQADSNYNIKKLFLDSYEQITTPGGQSSPGFQSAFNNTTTTGNLIVNYTGHGSERLWAVEEMLSQEDILSMTNEYKLPLYVTATCEFGRYDYAGEVSGAENLLLLAGGGAISLVTTTRPVFSSSNFNLNTAFYNVALTPKNDSTMRTLGDIMIGTKNQSLNGVYNRGFSLLGDPSLTLSYPKKTISITKVNGNNTSSIPDTIQALQTVTLEGEVQYYSGAKINTYNGQVQIKVYDKVAENNTLGDEKDSEGNPIIVTYKEQRSILFDGSASVENGKFTLTFVVPKDISYNYGAGKISMYATPNSGVIDANGYLNNIIIGGSDPQVTLDDTPPEIELFMDDESFVNGSPVDVNSIFIAKVKDDNGINTAGTGIGHEITAILDNDDSNPIILYSFYTSSLDSYREGEIRYFFEGLAQGDHTITFKVWDTHNNSSSKTISFNVAEELNAYNYPNPFTDFTTFVIDQTRSGASGTLEIQIINYKGGEETLLQVTFDESSNTTEEVEWDGKKPSGESLSAGLYFYRATLRYDSDEATFSKLDRLVKIE